MAQEKFTLTGLELESPLINAAGSINGTNFESIEREVRQLADTAIGAITVGSFTLHRQAGNEETYGPPVYYYDEKTATTYNSMGLPNIGVNRAAESAQKILCASQQKPTIFSVSPSLEPRTQDAVKQATALVDRMLLTGADVIELNVSCPNVVTGSGGRKPILGYDTDSMARLFDRFQTRFGLGQAIGLKLPPYITEEQKGAQDDIAELLTRHEGVFSHLIVANTIPNQVVRDAAGEPILSVPNGVGGMSGPSTKEEGRQQLIDWRELVDERYEIVSALGVDSGEEIAKRLELGATAVAGVTFLWESTDWGAAVTQILDEFAQVN